MAYVKVAREEDAEVTELPLKTNGNLLLLTLKSHFYSSTGLKFRSETHTVCDVLLEKDEFFPPGSSWGEGVYFCVFPNGEYIVVCYSTS